MIRWFDSFKNSADRLVDRKPSTRSCFILAHLSRQFIRLREWRRLKFRVRIILSNRCIVIVLFTSPLSSWTALETTTKVDSTKRVAFVRCRPPPPKEPPLTIVKLVCTNLFTAFVDIQCDLRVRLLICFVTPTFRYNKNKWKFPSPSNRTAIPLSNLFNCLQFCQFETIGVLVHFKYAKRQWVFRGITKTDTTASVVEDIIATK